MGLQYETKELTSGVETNFVENSSARLVTHVFVNNIWTELVQADGVRKGLAETQRSLDT